MSDDSKKMITTNRKIADACMATRAMLIDCDTCYWQTMCDFNYNTKNGIKTETTDAELIQRNME
jgi:hypothetical protein